MADACCEGSLDTQALENRQRRVLAGVLVINAATFVMMIAAAFMSNSSSLLSGALDNLGDAVTYGLSFAVVGMSVSAKAKVALFKGLLIAFAAAAVGAQIVWRLFHPDTPVFEMMGGAAILNLCANAFCLVLLHPHRHGDVNMMSVWECSRNDVFEGIAVIAAAALVWLFASGWPDVLVAVGLLVMFTRSASRVLNRAWADHRLAVASS